MSNAATRSQSCTGSGAKYQGQNESFWEHQGEAAIVWGYGSPEMRCSRKP
ncbi:MAG: MliC family protein [Desulfobacterales bacterium]|nr:MAG: MliC family protein [Desulfobacterales bacterium]